MGNVSILKMQTDLDNISFEMLEETEKAIFRAKDLTSQLLTFSKGGSPVKQTASLGEIIRESATFVLSGSNVKYEFNIPDDLWSIDVDVGQFNQVINNILINAKQAILEYGTITVTCQNVPYGEESFQNLRDLNFKGNFVRMSITDTGAGIPEEHLDKIFDPYFTTKEMGVGLGLASAYYIVVSHGGMIMVESIPGEGTTFQIFIPALDKVPDKNKETDKVVITGEGMILVMDDQEIVRESVSGMLEELGYNVSTVEDGTEAIKKYQETKESSTPYDVVIMDLTIPGGMGGKEAIVKLKEINPDVKAVVSSGYSHDSIMANHKDYGFSGILSKPYRLEELSRVIHDLLEG
jgi:CheY-like chemotaxis protein